MQILEDWHHLDQLILYFSGHGEIQHGMYSLIFGEEGARTSVPFGNVMTDIQAQGVTRAIVVLDACYSGAALKHGQKKLCRLDPPELHDLPRGLVVITSSRATESSYELEDGSASVFTHLFCEGIRTGLGGRSTPDGYIGPEDIVGYVNNQLTMARYSSYPQSPAYGVDNADRQVWLAHDRFRRSGGPTEDQPASSKTSRTLDELRLLYEQTEASRHPCPGVTVEDLDLDAISEFAQHIGDNANIAHENVRDAAARLGLYSPISEGKLHLAAVLCFAREPHRFVPQARALFTVGDKTTDDFRRVDIVGPLAFQVRRLFDLTRTEVVRHMRESKLEEFEQLFLRVIREAISNAVVHRDYQLPQIVQVAFNYPGIEIFSPGAMPNHRTFQSFLHGDKVSVPNDAAITWYLSQLLAYEGVGRGFTLFEEYFNRTTEPNFRWSGGGDDDYLKLSFTHPRDISRNVSRVTDEAALTGSYGAEESPDATQFLPALDITLPPTATAPDVDIEHGRRIGKYEIVHLLAKGGMGPVYLARDPALNRQVALKLLSLRFDSEEWMKRFEQEAQIIANFRHPNIVAVYDFSRHEDLMYMAFEYVEGGDLTQLVDKGATSPEQTLSIVRQVAHALDYAHSKGVIHRDIKPGNILISGQDRYLLTDFGIAKRQNLSDVTAFGVTMGTMNYMSPEALANPSAIDARSDLYGLGVVMFELLTGKRWNSRVAKQDPREVNPKVPRSLSEICRKATAPEPDARYQSAEQFIKELENLQVTKFRRQSENWFSRLFGKN